MKLFAEWETSPEKARLSSNAIDAGFKVQLYLPWNMQEFNCVIDPSHRGGTEGDGPRVQRPLGYVLQGQARQASHVGVIVFHPI